VVGALAFGLSHLMRPVFTAHTSFVSPQQPASGLSAALSSLGPLAGLAMGNVSTRNTTDLYASLLRSDTVSDRMIARFKLREVYKADFQFEARERLAQAVRVTIGKKDGVVSVEVDDHDPQRAADMANALLEELRRLTGQLALTEVQRRRVFFESQLKQARDRLTVAQQALESSGIGRGALRAEPRAAAEEYARLRAEIAAGEVRLQALQRSLTNTSAEVQQQQGVLSALRSQLRSLESTSQGDGSSDYVSRYREFKYQETLFDLLARQFEAAKLDESREELVIQVVDPAQKPEWKSKPKRAVIAVVAALLAWLVLMVGLVVHYLWQRAAQEPQRAEKLQRLRNALRRR
jgi:uncharacterized protein involved in exopolysaccharide biosynthesis